MEYPKISVIVPIYNVEKYLDKCIESIVNQTYQNLEILLVDDGSPDNCPRICDKWAKRDSRIRVIHKKNGGVSTSRNAGLDAATGDYIGFVDGDDIISPDMYQTLYTTLIKNNVQISFCSFCSLDENFNKRNVGRLFSPTPKVYSSDDILKEIFVSIDCHLVSLCNKLFQKQLFDGLRFPEGRVFEDWTLAPIIYSKAEKLYFVPKKYYCYIIHQGSIVRTKTIKRYYDCVLADYDHYKYFNHQSITDYNDKIVFIIWADFRKMCKTYRPSRTNRQMLNDAYKKCCEVRKSKKGALFYHFPNTIRILADIKNRIEK